MKPIIVIVIIMILVLITINCCSPRAKGWTEADYKAYVAKKLGGKVNYLLDGNTCIDIVTDEYAIEVDYIYRWENAVGKALYKSLMINRRHGVVLILEKRKNYRNYLDKILLVADRYLINVWTVNIKGKVKKVN